MRVTRVFLMPISPGPGRNRPLAGGSFSLDDRFSVDCRVVPGDRGPRVAMPSRWVTDRCAACGSANPVISRFCGWCGDRLAGDRPGEGQRRQADVAFATDAEFRETIREAVLGEYARIVAEAGEG